MSNFTMYNDNNLSSEVRTNTRNINLSMTPLILTINSDSVINYSSSRFNVLHLTGIAGLSILLQNLPIGLTFNIDRHSVNAQRDVKLTHGSNSIILQQQGSYICNVGADGKLNATLHNII